MAGITHGFRVGFNHPSGPLVSAKRNLLGVIHHPGMVNQYLAEEIYYRRIVGPFHPDHIPQAHISRFEVIPKNHQPNKWCLIVDLSHPSGKWENLLYVDTCLPFGLRSAPKLLNILADLLSWILELMGVSQVMHYLNDFLTLGAPDSPSCLHNLQVIKVYVSTWTSH